MLDMILCPKCNSEELQNFSCKECFHFVEVREQTPFFHPEAVEGFEDHSHESLVSIQSQESSHFWFRTRFEFIAHIFRAAIALQKRQLKVRIKKIYLGKQP